MVRMPQLRDLSLNPAALNGVAADPQKLVSQTVVRFINNPRWDALRGVEPTRHFRHRVVQTLEGIVAAHPGSTVVVVTHQAIINAYLSMVLGIQRDMFFRPEFASVSTLRVLGDLYAVQDLNDHAHLMPSFSPR
jgi:broad specificity phosphatase PhoE